MTVARTVLYVLARTLGCVRSGCCCTPLVVVILRKTGMGSSTHTTEHALEPRAFILLARNVLHVYRARWANACTGFLYIALALLQCAAYVVRLM